jgi:prepilin-type N-terminal cleavage/methylation domain-containing protein
MGARACKAAARLRCEEGGFTLIELLIATALGLVVIGAALVVFVGGVRSQPRAASKAAALEQARVTVDQITRELRQGLEISSGTTPTASQLSVVTYVKAAACGGPARGASIPCRVTYSCSGESCARVVAAPDGSAPGPSEQIATGLSTPDVFSYRPSATAPTYVGVSFSFATGGEPVTLGDGAALRNVGEGP